MMIIINNNDNSNNYDNNINSDKNYDKNNRKKQKKYLLKDSTIDSVWTRTAYSISVLSFAFTRAALSSTLSVVRDDLSFSISLYLISFE